MSYTSVSVRLLLAVVGIVFALPTMSHASTFTPYGGNPVFSYSGVSGQFDQNRVYNPVVVKDSDGYKLYYLGLQDSNFTQIGLATSSDGIHWVRPQTTPVFRCGENMLSTCTTGGVWSSYRVVPTAVIHEDGMYKMWYSGNNVNLNGAFKLGYATSTDGVQWTAYAHNPVFTAQEGSAGNAYINVINIDGIYHVYYQRGAAPDLYLATSTDGIVWSSPSNAPVISSPNGFFSVSELGGTYIAIDRGGLTYTSNDGEAFESGQATDITTLSWIDGSESLLFDGGVVKKWYTIYEGNVLWSSGNFSIGYATTTLAMLGLQTNQAPVLDPVGDKIIHEGQELTFTLAATDPDGNMLSYAVANVPDGAAFDPVTATFNWTPTSTQAGTYPGVSFTVTDNGVPVASTTEVITITVINASTAPVVLTTHADATLLRGNDDRNEGANARLRVRSGGDNRIVIAFEASTIAEYISQNGLARAQLVVSIADNGNNWGNAGRTVDAHPLLESFVEGNGKDFGVPGVESTRGTGSGVTWHCAIDTNIKNQSPNCNHRWNGGAYGAATASSALVTNKQTGEIVWDVTQDVLNGSFSWLVRKTNEGKNGRVEFYSKEGAVVAGDMLLAPRLVLEPQDQ